MAEAERAAKAARAKALLKKRQQKKAADEATTVSSRVASPVLSPSRTFSPAPSEDDRRDLGDVFTHEDSDTNWLNSLPRAPSPSAPYIPHAPVHSSLSTQAVTVSIPDATKDRRITELEGALNTLEAENASLLSQVNRVAGIEKGLESTRQKLEEEQSRSATLNRELQQIQLDKEMALERERQTISLLVSEKNSLTAQVVHLADLELKVQSLEASLQDEELNSKKLNAQMQELQSRNQEMSTTARLAQANEKGLSERCRDQERQLQLLTASANELREEGEECRRKLRDLEEQIQSDDRVERLETSLKNTQNRGDELEFQLSKFKQANAALKVERDNLETQCQTYGNDELEWKAKESEQGTKLSSLYAHLESLSSEKNSLAEEHSKLQGQVEQDRKSTSELQERLANTAAEIASNKNQLQVAHRELRSANRRADEAERIQKNLQAEGTNLMHAVDEMRPKIVELTQSKIDLTEKVESLGHSLQNRDVAIAKLEATVDETRNAREEAEEKWKERTANLNHTLSQTQLALEELQKAYSQLQEEHESTFASLRNLEQDRTNHHQESARQLEEIDRLTSGSRTQTQELSELRTELHARQQAQDEEDTFLERAHNEIEHLRAEIESKDTEMEQLRQSVSSPRSSIPQSLDNEIVSSLRQQHALDLSAAQSQIRSLENTIFDAEAKSHTLQKRINLLEDQLTQARASHRSSPLSSRPSSRNQRDSDFRRPSGGSHRPSNLAPPLSRSVFEQGMSPTTMHKRKVSLSMLKARIASEAATSPRPSSRVLSPVQSDSSSGAPDPGIVHRPQFLDDSHVFWCHSCHGDLVIL